MKTVVMIIYILKIILLLLIALMYLNIIPDNGPFFTIVHKLFKIVVGLYIIYYFTRKEMSNIDFHDRLIMIIAGAMLALSSLKNTCD